jgi:hypothetical protein
MYSTGKASQRRRLKDGIRTECTESEIAELKSHVEISGGWSAVPCRDQYGVLCRGQDSDPGPSGGGQSVGRGSGRSMTLSAVGDGLGWQTEMGQFLA